MEIVPILVRALLCALPWSLAYCFVCPQFEILLDFDVPILPPRSDLNSILDRETTNKYQAVDLMERYNELSALGSQVDVSPYLTSSNEICWMLLSFGSFCAVLGRSVSGDSWERLASGIAGLVFFYGFCFLLCKLLRRFVPFFEPHTEAGFRKNAESTRRPIPRSFLSLSAYEFYDFCDAEVSVFSRLSVLRKGLLDRLRRAKQYGSVVLVALCVLTVLLSC